MRASVRRALGSILHGEESESLRKSLVASTSGTLLLNIGALAWNLLAILILTRVLGARGYGAYAYTFAWSSLLGVLAVLGLPSLVVREVAAYEARGEPQLVRGIIRRSYQAILVGSVVVVAAAALVGVLLVGLGQPDVQRSYLLGLLLIPLVGLYRLGEGVMRGFQRVVSGRIAETTVQPLLTVAFVVTANAVSPNGIGPTGAMSLTVAAAGVATVVSHVLVRHTLPAHVEREEPRYQTRAWLRSLQPLFLLSSAQTVQPQIGVILLGGLRDITASGVLNVGLRWAGFVSFMQLVVSFPLAPAVARLHASGDGIRLQRLVSAATVAATVAAVPIAIVLLVSSERVLALFGHSFIGGSGALTILVLGELVNVSSGPVALILIMTNHERVVATFCTGAVVANVVLGAALIPTFGLEGAAIARAVTQAGLNAILMWRLWREEHIYAGVLGGRLVRRMTTSSS